LAGAIVLATSVATGAAADPAPPTNAETPAAPAAINDAATQPDPIGDLVTSALTGALPGSADYHLRATLYHGGVRGIRDRDSLGCHVVAMRTAAVDGHALPRHTILFIKETVGLPLPGGGRHDGYWYASDVGGAIHEGRIDLFTGTGAASMRPLMPLNLATLTVMKAGVFDGCPPADRNGALASNTRF
jgi:3D (Asp-Asp-Asp) domain-containing protein